MDTIENVEYYVRCIDSSGTNNILVHGDIYPIYPSTKKLETDYFIKGYWNRKRFQKIENGDIFNVGEEVIIRKDLISDNRYLNGISFVDHMEKFKGKKYKIIKKGVDVVNYFGYNLKGCNSWNFAPNMFEEYIHPEIKEKNKMEQVKCISELNNPELCNIFKPGEIYDADLNYEKNSWFVYNENCRGVHKISLLPGSIIHDNQHCFEIIEKKKNEFENPQRKYGFVRTITKTEAPLIYDTVEFKIGDTAGWDIYITSKEFISIIKVLGEKNKLSAIKIWRCIFQVDLKDAKEAVEFVCENM